MRADIMKWACSHMTARDAVILVLTSDREVSINVEKTSVGHGRSVKSLKEYNSKIDHSVLLKLIKEGLVEPVGFNYRLAPKSKNLSVR